MRRGEDVEDDESVAYIYVCMYYVCIQDSRARVSRMGVISRMERNNNNYDDYDDDDDDSDG